jgi:hypothetical protein
MDSSLDRQLETAIAEFNATRERLESLGSMFPDDDAVTIRSSDRRVSVSAGPRGEIRSVKFHGESYRTLAPAELGKIVMETVERARREAVEATREKVSAAFPSAFGSIGNGEIDLDNVWTSFLRSIGHEELADEFGDDKETGK